MHGPSPIRFFDTDPDGFTMELIFHPVPASMTATDEIEEGVELVEPAWIVDARVVIRRLKAHA